MSHRPDFSDSILYGQTGPRSPEAQDYVDLDPSGALAISSHLRYVGHVEYYDAAGELCLVVVSDNDPGYRINYFDERHRVRIGQQEPLRGQLVFDQPGTRLYINDLQLHRDDGPAVECSDGSWTWYQHGYIHRDGQPADRHADGSLRWARYGLLHRLGDLPALEDADGFCAHYVYGKLHRVDGPAETSSHGASWWKYGLRHRKDGPAQVFTNTVSNYWWWGSRCADAAEHQRRCREASGDNGINEHHLREWGRYCNRQERRTWPERLLQAL